MRSTWRRIANEQRVDVFLFGKAEIRFIRGRLKFGGCKNSAPFPSAIVVFKPEGEPA